MNRRSALLVVAVAIVLVGGAGAVWHFSASPMERCARLGDPHARDDCRLEIVMEQGESPESLTSAIDAIDDPTARDIVRMRIAVMDPNRGNMLCRHVEGEFARDWCERVRTRPHLYSAPPR